MIRAQSSTWAIGTGTGTSWPRVRSGFSRRRRRFCERPNRKRFLNFSLLGTIMEIEVVKLRHRATRRVNSPEQVYEYASDIKDAAREVMAVILVDSKNGVLD